MKKLAIAIILASSIVLISSCSGGYTCPTYMKIDDKQMNKTVELDSEQV